MTLQALPLRWFAPWILLTLSRRDALFCARGRAAQGKRCGMSASPGRCLVYSLLYRFGTTIASISALRNACGYCGRRQAAADGWTGDYYKHTTVIVQFFRSYYPRLLSILTILRRFSCSTSTSGQNFVTPASRIRLLPPCACAARRFAFLCVRFCFCIFLTCCALCARGGSCLLACVVPCGKPCNERQPSYYRLKFAFCDYQRFARQQHYYYYHPMFIVRLTLHLLRTCVHCIYGGTSVFHHD